MPGLGARATVAKMEEEEEEEVVVVVVVVEVGNEDDNCRLEKGACQSG